MLYIYIECIERDIRVEEEFSLKENELRLLALVEQIDVIVHIK